MGPVGLPAASAAAAPGGDHDHRAVRRSGAVGRCGPADAARSRVLHGRGDRELRVRAARARAGHERPPGAPSGGPGLGVPTRRPEPARTRRCRPAGAARSAARGPLGGGFDGARCPGVPGPDPALRDVSDPGSVRLAAGRLAGLDRTAPAGPGVRGHGSAVSWRAARDAPLERPAGRAERAGPGLAGCAPARAGTGVLAAPTVSASNCPTDGGHCRPEDAPYCDVL